MAQTKQKSRGGRRNGAGRAKTLGPTVRRDLRVPEHIERTAIGVGNGAFSDGMRYMCEEYIRLDTRNTSEEIPPTDTAILIYIVEAERWAIVRAEIVDGQVVFYEQGVPGACHVSATWRHLPDPE